jgi:hypothetical protein
MTRATGTIAQRIILSQKKGDPKRKAVQSTIHRYRDFREVPRTRLLDQVPVGHLPEVDPS